MAMNLGPATGEDEVLSQINTTPLVDVMLVLLIIFLITIPVVTSSIAVTLPKERIEAEQSKPENIIVSIDKSGGIFWFETPVLSMASLIQKLEKTRQKKPQPVIQIRGDMAAQFESVGKVMYASQQAGISKVAFITEPPAP